MDADSFPTADVGLALHSRLLSGDRHAILVVCRLYLPPLTAALSRRFPRHADLALSAAHDAVFAYLQHPKTYDPTRLDLGRFLRMAARRDLLNLLRRDRRQARALNPLPEVELAADGGNGVEEALARERADAARALVRRVRDGLGPADRGVLDLLLGEERRTAPYAELLGLTGLPPEDQERAVKRAKDRVKKRILRGGFADDRSGAGDGRSGAA